MKKGLNALNIITSCVLLGVFIAGQGCKESVAVKSPGQPAVEIALTPENLSKIERSSVTLPTKDDTAIRQYEGFAIWRLLEQAGLSSGKIKPKEIVKRYLVAQGKDGFKVVFSLAELDTAFTRKKVLLADKLNGKDLSADRGPYQLIVRDELRPTRNCYQIVKLTVYEAEPENNQNQ